MTIGDKNLRLVIGICAAVGRKNISYAPSGIPLTAIHFSLLLASPRLLLLLLFFLPSSSSSSSFHSLDLVVDLPPLFQKFENRKIEEGRKKKEKKKKERKENLHNRLRARFINVYLGVVVTRRDSIRIKWNEGRRREEFSRRRPTFRRIESDGRLSFFIDEDFFPFLRSRVTKKIISHSVSFSFLSLSLSLFSFPSPFFSFLLLLPPSLLLLFLRAEEKTGSSMTD